MSTRTAWRPDPTEEPRRLLNKLYRYDPKLKKDWNRDGMNAQVKLATMGLRLGFQENEVKDLLLHHRRNNQMDLKLNDRSYYDNLLKEVRRGMHKRAS